MRMLRASILFLFIVMSVQSVSAQDTPFNSAYSDSVMTSYLKKISYWSSGNKNYLNAQDSLAVFNKQLMDYLKNIATDVRSIGAKFPLAENRGLINITSDDNRLRLYSWDTWTGSTMHYFDALAQYNIGGASVARILNDISDAEHTPDPGSYFSEINSIHTSDGRSVYLVSDYTIASKNEKANGIKAYMIDKGELKNVPFFKTRKLTTNYIDFVYNVSYDSLTSIVISIHLSSDKKKLYVPVVMKNGHLQNKYWLYVFKGDKFVYKKRVKGV